MLLPAFGGNTPEQIYEAITNIVDDKTYVVLNKNKTISSISIFDNVVFRIRVNSRTRCLDTENPIAIEYASMISGASVTKMTVHIPLEVDEDELDIVKNLIKDVYDQRRSQASGDSFACCNDYVRCSNERSCLHLKNRDYWGCQYRKNLEEGRIFYGRNKNSNR